MKPKVGRKTTTKIRYQKTFFIMEWFSADRVQWPRNRSLQATSTGRRAVKDHIIRVGKKSTIHEGSCSSVANQPTLIFSPILLTWVRRTSGVVRKRATIKTAMLTRRYLIFNVNPDTLKFSQYMSVGSAAN